MKYPHFTELSAEIKLQIVRKCHALPYVRLRQTCRHMDDFCEAQRKWIGIYCYRDEPQLYLTDTLNIPPFKQAKSSTEEDLNETHVVVNYGKNYGDHSFSVPMTEENVLKIRASLSGFHFFKIFLVNSAGDTDDEKNKRYDRALGYFLEVASQLNKSSMTIQDLTTKQTQLALDMWKKATEDSGITTVYKEKNLTVQQLKKFIQHEKVKTVKYCDYIISSDFNGLNEELIKEMTKGKKKFRLICPSLPIETTVNTWNSLHRFWRGQGSRPDSFALFSKETRYYFDLPQGHTVNGSVHAVSLTNHQLNFKENTLEPVKCDVWIHKKDNNEEWEYIAILRVRKDGARTTDVCFTRRSNLPKKSFIVWFLKSFNLAYPGNAYDLSSLHNRLEKLETPEEMKAEYRKMVDDLRRFYTETKIVETNEEVPVVLEVAQ